MSKLLTSPLLPDSLLPLTILDKLSLNQNSKYFCMNACNFLHNKHFYPAKIFFTSSVRNIHRETTVRMINDLGRQLSRLEKLGSTKIHASSENVFFHEYFTFTKNT